MKKILTPWRFERLKDDTQNRNWFKGHLFMETPKGNVIVIIEHRHLQFWQEEFELTLEEVESRLINPQLT